MNAKRFTARTSRDALVLVRQALGEDAVVLSTKPCPDGFEVLAMAPESLRQIERMAQPGNVLSSHGASPEPAVVPVSTDVAELSMSTLSFQDYVRERLLKRRKAALNAKTKEEPGVVAQPPMASKMSAPSVAQPPEHFSVLEQRMAEKGPAMATPVAPIATAKQRETVIAREEKPLAAGHSHTSGQGAWTSHRDQQDMLHELRQVKGLIEQRFDALAFTERMDRQPIQARMVQKMLGCGFSPALIRKLADSLPADVADETEWVASVLEHNLLTAETEASLEDQGGVYALVGSTGVGKTTTTAKIAAAFATKYGAGNLGLITLDAYRMGAHEQLRAYGRILGVTVHTAHDRASLEDLLELLVGKKMVLIDTAGMAQRDARTRELLDMLSHRSIRKLLVLNAASQGETIEDVMVSYRVADCAGMVLSKMDEAIKLGPALDALIRHKAKVVGVANGQRVPEDWHRLSANALVHRALRNGASSAYLLDANDVSLVFATTHGGTGMPRPTLHV